MTTANERQVGGTHYSSSLQHWDVCVKYGVQYLEAAATKYVTRWQKKDGLRDLEKAGHYLQKLIEENTDRPGAEQRRMKLLTAGFGRVNMDDVFNFVVINGLRFREASFCRLVFTWTDIGHLRDAAKLLEEIIQEEKDRLAQVKAEQDARPRAVEQTNPRGFQPEGE